jgi:hypothetical protein
VQQFVAKLLPASSEKAEYKRQHDLSSHFQLWSCQQKTTTNMQFELQREPSLSVLVFAGKITIFQVSIRQSSEKFDEPL